jgi:hypothetical protein
MINRTIRIGMLALALCSFAAAAEAKNVYRFSAQWSSNADGSDCSHPNFVLLLQSTAADIDVVSFTYQAFDVCNGFRIVTGSGTASITGNQNKLHVDGVLPLSGGGDVDVDVDIRKTIATGTVILNGVDLTGGQPSTTASITKSKN